MEEVQFFHEHIYLVPKQFYHQQVFINPIFFMGSHVHPALYVLSSFK